MTMKNEILKFELIEQVGENDDIISDTPEINMCRHLVVLNGKIIGRFGYSWGEPSYQDSIKFIEKYAKKRGVGYTIEKSVSHMLI